MATTDDNYARKVGNAVTAQDYCGGIGIDIRAVREKADGTIVPGKGWRGSLAEAIEVHEALGAMIADVRTALAPKAAKKGRKAA